MYRNTGLIQSANLYFHGFSPRISTYSEDDIGVAAAADETSIFGTTSLIRQLPKYKYYVRYTLRILYRDISHLPHDMNAHVRTCQARKSLPFIPQCTDESYLEINLPWDYHIPLFVQAIIRTDSNCLHILCLYPWQYVASDEIKSSDILSSVTYDGNILRLVHSVILFCAYHINQLTIAEESLKKLATDLQMYNPKVYREIRESYENFPTHEYFQLYETPHHDILDFLRNIGTSLY